MSLVACDFKRNLLLAHNIIIHKFEFCCLTSLFFSLFESNSRLLSFRGAGPVDVKYAQYIPSFQLYVI